MTPTALDRHAQYNDAIDPMLFQIDSTTDGAGHIFPGIYTVEAATLAATVGGVSGTRPQAFVLMC